MPESELITGQEVEAVSAGLLARLSDKRISWGRPQILQTSGENVLTAVSPVLQEVYLLAGRFLGVAIHGLATFYLAKGISAIKK